jgi:hypothetical protein
MEAVSMRPSQCQARNVPARQTFYYPFPDSLKLSYLPFLWKSKGENKKKEEKVYRRESRGADSSYRNPPVCKEFCLASKSISILFQCSPTTFVSSRCLDRHVKVSFLFFKFFSPFLFVIFCQYNAYVFVLFCFFNLG